MSSTVPRGPNAWNMANQLVQSQRSFSFQSTARSPSSLPSRCTSRYTHRRSHDCHYNDGEMFTLRRGASVFTKCGRRPLASSMSGQCHEAHNFGLAESTSESEVENDCNNTCSSFLIHPISHVKLATSPTSVPDLSQSTQFRSPKSNAAAKDVSGSYPTADQHDKARSVACPFFRGLIKRGSNECVEAKSIRHAVETP